MVEVTENDKNRAKALSDTYPGKNDAEILEMYEKAFPEKSVDAKQITDDEKEIVEYVWGSVECELMRNVPRLGGKPELFEVIPLDVVFPKDLSTGQHISGNIIALARHEQLTGNEYKMVVAQGTQNLDDAVIDGIVDKVKPGVAFTSLFTSRFDGHLGFLWGVPDSLDVMRENGHRMDKSGFLNEVRRMKSSSVTLQDIIDHFSEWKDDGKLYLSSTNPVLRVVDAWRGKSKKGNLVGFYRVGDSSLKEPVKVMSEWGGIAARASYEQIRLQSGEVMMLFEVTGDTNNEGAPMLDIHGIIDLGGEVYKDQPKREAAKGKNSFDKEEIAPGKDDAQQTLAPPVTFEKGEGGESPEGGS